MPSLGLLALFSSDVGVTTNAAAIGGRKRFRTCILIRQGSMHGVGNGVDICFNCY